MLTEERHKKIMDLLNQESIVKSQELSDILDASESTIRRDLQDLEKAGMLERVHGGAKLKSDLGSEQSMNEKSIKNIQEKQLLAKSAAETVSDGDVIYLDAGTTTLEMIPHLTGKEITAVTNSVHHAAKLIDLNINTIILGGTLKLSTKAIIGTTSMEQLRQFRFNKVFMGMNGVHPEFGLTTPDPEEAALKRLAIQHAEQAFVLVDHSKLNKVSFTKVADVEQVILLVDQCPKDLLKELEKKTIIKEAAK